LRSSIPEAQEAVEARGRSSEMFGAFFALAGSMYIYVHLCTILRICYQRTNVLIEQAFLMSQTGNPSNPIFQTQVVSPSNWIGIFSAAAGGTEW
jgi:hypothetical protein